ncbi:M23 family metallopeptidase [Hoeflea sp.]|uniref:M23 family metallopeptidase n=1 Tax=Hoeflea sp. TaxID=1940281 RepID=UPI001987EB3B|nr:M23 family metallopeptidase [Hoeflea sp.]MBC7280237.1 M23 family metallopeptidase [Hoeflea sp.]
MSRSVSLVVLAALPVSAEPLFGLPLVCPQGAVCPIQQFVDLDPGPGVSDPWCGTKTYDGHKGTDFRVLSMRDVDRGVEVVAMADGVVKAFRDGMADRLVSTDPERQAISSRECGNGIVLDHGGGFETQYCHMRQGSLRLETGAKVRKGDVLGLVGASGLAAFPHVHVTLRRNGKEIDPFTGSSAGESCTTHDAGAAASGLLDAGAMAELGTPDLPTVLSAGFADGPVNDRQFMSTGLPDPPGRQAQALVGYIWAINLAEADRFMLRIEKDGRLFSEQLTEPLDRSKAVYVAFAGRKGAPQPGLYRLEAAILRQGETIALESRALTVD